MTASTPPEERPSVPADTDAAAGALPFHTPEAYRDYQHNRHLEQRNELLVSLLPDQARHVLDIGSGPGVAGRAMAATGRTVWSLDASLAALRSAPPRPVCGSATALPFPEGGFDLALSFELLEHLPPAAVPEAAREIARVSRRWIVIGVPHRENLRRNLLRCPACGHEFNRSGHQNRFDAGDLRRLFPDWRVRATHICGPPVREYRKPLLWARHRIGRKYSEMGGLGGVRCPRCGSNRFPRFRHSLLSLGLDAANKLLSRRRPYWIIQLLEKEGPRARGERAADPPPR
jgi:SAM-dependent methyltransferase